MRRSRKPLGGLPPSRGFESLPLRQEEHDEGSGSVSEPFVSPRSRVACPLDPAVGAATPRIGEESLARAVSELLSSSHRLPPARLVAASGLSG